MKMIQAIAASLALTLVSGAALAADDDLFAYQDITPAVPTTSGDKIEVVEMFWYGCPHCYAFEPVLNNWKKSLPKDVAFVRVPAIFNPRWEFSARVYYTAEVLGVLDKLHEHIFDAIHKQHIPLNNEVEVEGFFARYGVDKKLFQETFHSFAVNSKVNWARHLTKAYGIDGVPTMIVNGKYRTSASLAGGHEEVLQVVDGLIARERKSK
jgi:thiol:disulfide interchange protein DsbA